MSLNKLLGKLIFSCFIFSHFLRVVHVNEFFRDDSEDFVGVRAVKIVDVDIAFENVIWEHDTTDAIRLIDLIDVVECFENLFIFFVDTDGIIDFNLTFEV